MRPAKVKAGLFEFLPVQIAMWAVAVWMTAAASNMVCSLLWNVVSAVAVLTHSLSR
jgi:hypothetical protein